MDITKFGKEIKEVGKDPQEDILTMEKVFNETLEIGKYKFKIKQIKGQDLFRLVNTFMFSGTRVAVKVNGKEVKDIKDVKDSDYQVIDSDSMEDIFNQFGKHFDFAMSYVEFSMNNTKYNDLLVNGIYQVPEVETNVALMYRLMFFIYRAVILFTQISRQQLEDMN